MNKTCPRCQDGAGSNQRNHPRYFSTSYPFWSPGGSHPRSRSRVSVHDHLDQLDPLDHLCQYS